MSKQFVLLITLLFFGSHILHAQKNKISFRDSLDGAFDLSDWVIDANGFIPVLMPITEPAVGFGGALAAVFLTKKDISRADIETDRSLAFVPPDITLAFGAYTANGTWATGGGRIGTFLKSRLRYRAFGLYTDANLDFYRTFPILGERKFEFNIQTTLVYLSLLRQIARSNFHAGLQYTFANTKVRIKEGNLPDFITSKELKNVGSVLGAVLEYDNRDNTFTPNKGLKAHFHANWSNQVLGSDFNNIRLQLFATPYLELTKSWVSGFRLEGNAVFGEVPFYAEPFIDLRGVPAARYQGDYTILLETEQRLRIIKRWSIIGFGGIGQAYQEEKEFKDTPVVYNFGAGVRYLVARKFGLHMGVDVARGPENWALYIVFGSSWSR